MTETETWCSKYLKQSESVPWTSSINTHDCALRLRGGRWIKCISYVWCLLIWQILWSMIHRCRHRLSYNVESILTTHWKSPPHTHTHFLIPRPPKECEGGLSYSSTHFLSYHNYNLCHLMHTPRYTSQMQGLAGLTCHITLPVTCWHVQAGPVSVILQESNWGNRVGVFT